MSKSLTLVLADSQPLFLDGMAAVLPGRGHAVLAAATSVQDLLHAVSRHRPELCLIDTNLPDGDGIAAIGEIAGRSPGTRIVVLTADGNETLMTRALDAGAHGFAHKSRGLPVLLRVLDRVAAGERMTALAGGRPENRFLRHDAGSIRELASFLTPRELDCLNLLAAGLDTSQMARRLGVSITTVRSHVQAVLTKLGARTRLEAASMAIRNGLVRPDPLGNRVASCG
jgi:DNA-binding NarL/FixJ family response regulator